MHDVVPSQLVKWKADGIIARIESKRLVGQIKRLRLPTVDVLGWHPIPGVPRFGNDREAVVRLAVEYLRQLGLQHFAYCGLPGLTFSEVRGRLFAEMVRRLGYLPLLYEDARKRSHADTAAAETEPLLRAKLLARWLRALPKPVGLMACNDACAQQVLAICRDYGIDVPDEVAVIGVDNDRVAVRVERPCIVEREH